MQYVIMGMAKAGGTIWATLPLVRSGVRSTSATASRSWRQLSFVCLV